MSTSWESHCQAELGRPLTLSGPSLSGISRFLTSVHKTVLESLCSTSKGDVYMYITCIYRPYELYTISAIETHRPQRGHCIGPNHRSNPGRRLPDCTQCLLSDPRAKIAPGMQSKEPYAIDVNISQHRCDEDIQTTPALLSFLLPCVYLFGQL